MPEATDPMARRGGGEIAGGFFISRMVSPGAMAAAAVAAGSRKVRAFSAKDGKENFMRMRSSRHRKSPLPSWYPRTPMRDITAIVNALEMRRARVRAAQAQAGDLNAEASPGTTLLATHLALEATPHSRGLPFDAPNTSPSSIPTIETTNAPSPLLQPQTSPTPASISQSPQASSGSVHGPDPVPATGPIVGRTAPKLSDTPGMLCSSMDQIEKAVEKYMKRTPKQPVKRVARRALMSMR